MALTAVGLITPVIHLVLVTGQTEFALPRHSSAKREIRVTARGGASHVNLHGMGRWRRGDVTGAALQSHFVVFLVAAGAVHGRGAQLQSLGVARGAVLRRVVRVVEGQVAFPGRSHREGHGPLDLVGSRGTGPVGVAGRAASRHRGSGAVVAAPAVG